jgi:hypothetical protein
MTQDRVFALERVNACLTTQSQPASQSVDSRRISHCAYDPAGIVVGRHGTATVTREELEQAAGIVIGND